MDLRDATDKASVNQFVRSLAFPFRMETVTGIPGAFFGPSAKNADERCALLMHELEHLITLTSPLGLFYTGLGLRLKDLHDDTVRHFNDWNARVQEDVFDGMHKEALAIAEKLTGASRFAKSVLCMSEYILPLLEGLALIAEMELTRDEDAHTFRMMVSLEYWRIYYLSLLTDPRQILDFQDDKKRAVILSSLFDALNVQLEYSRNIRRLSLGDRLFFQDRSTAEIHASSPYFLGYMFVRRLLGQWRQTAPGLPIADLYGIARIAISSLLPLTLLLASLKAHVQEDGDIAIKESTVSSAIEGLLTLSERKLREISRCKLLAFDIEAEQLTNASGTDDADDDVMSWVLAGLFPGLAPELRKQTKQGLWAIERSKFVKQFHTAQVVVGGVNEKHELALLADTSTIRRVDSNSVSGGSGTWFPFKHDDFAEFIRVYDDEGKKLSRIDLHEAPIKVTAPPKILVGTLSTYCVFHPFGVSSADGTDSLTMPMAIVQRLRIDNEESSRVFESGTVTRADFSGIIEWQPINAAFAEGVSNALEPSLKQYRETGAGILQLYLQLLAGKALVNAVAEAANDSDQEEGEKETRDKDEYTEQSEFDQYGERVIDACQSVIKGTAPEWHQQMQSRCRAFYAGLLFPKCRDAEALSVSKLDVLEGHLATEDLNKLREWLLYGAVIDRKKACSILREQTDTVRADVQRIRSVCSSVLGVPVIQFSHEEEAVLLDLLPPVIAHDADAL
jgi:hypothetical protein